jgi:hypothetical protein
MAKIVNDKKELIKNYLFSTLNLLPEEENAEFSDVQNVIV